MGNSGWNLEQCMSLTMRINISFESIYHFLCRLLASHFVVQGAAHHLSTQVPNTGTTDMNHHFLFCPNMIFSFYLLVSQKDQCYSPVFSLLFNMFIICRLLMCNATSFNILEKQQVQNVLSSCYIFFFVCVCIFFLMFWLQRGHHHQVTTMAMPILHIPSHFFSQLILNIFY